jgi:glycosyltransferase involved in cell wall biosynthesis
MEALASGTPVIARKVGALAEILQDGRTGYFASSVEEMAAALNNVCVVSAEACRREAQERFSSRAMTQGYLDLFGRLAPA